MAKRYKINYLLGKITYTGIALVMSTSIGTLISYWRKIRKKSQMELALEVQVSPRHLSFIESGKARPSRNLILRLATSLRLSFRQSNALLNSAGFSALYPDFVLDDEQMQPVKKALDLMLSQHEPFPAVVVNPVYDILFSNASYKNLIEWLAGKNILKKYPNVYRLVFAEDGLRPYFVDWEIIALALLTRLHDEALFTQNENIFKLYAELKNSVKIKAPAQSLINLEVPIISFGLQKDKIKLEFFSALTAFSTPASITTQEIRVENIFPANSQTRLFLMTNYND